MNKLITINLSYYNENKEDVLRHINFWKSFPPEILKLFTFFIVDDCSKVPINELLIEEDLNGLDIDFYRVMEDLYFNIAGVRNLGAKQCKTPYFIILDMDTIINKLMATNLVKLALKYIKEPIAFKFNRKVIGDNKLKDNKIHPAVCLVRTEDYWNIGGCEEDLVGHYGHTDPCFWERSKGKIKVVILKNCYLLYYPDAEIEDPRDSSWNYNIFMEKCLKKNWSNKYLRFKWIKL